MGKGLKELETLPRVGVNAPSFWATTHSAGCYLSSVDTGGAHTVTIHPSGEWLTVNTSFAGLEVVDIRGPEPRLVHFVPRAVVDQAHDVSFSRDGNTLYSAGISSTRIVDVTNAPLLFVPGNHDPALTAPQPVWSGWPATIENPHLVDPPVQRSPPLLGGPQRQPRVHLGLPRRLGGLGEPLPLRGVGLLLTRLLGGLEPGLQLRQPSQCLLARRLCLGDRLGHPLGLRARGTGHGLPCMHRSSAASKVVP